MKSSEILQVILNKIIAIEKVVKLNDFQQKLIIKRLNKIDLVKNEVVEEQKLHSMPGKVIAPDPTPEVLNQDLKQKKNKLMTIVKKNNEDYNFDVKINDTENTNSVDLNGDNNLPSYPVIQKISGNDGKLVKNANIVIKDFDGKVIKKIGTNSSGRWQAALVPGKYTADIEWKNGKEKLSFIQSFEVVKSAAPILLPMPEMYKVYTE